MKPFAGAFTLLLAGLSGCLSVTGQPGREPNKSTTEAKAAPGTGGPAASGSKRATAAGSPAVPLPASPQWTNPSDQPPGQRAQGFVDHTAARTGQTPALFTPPAPGPKPAPLPSHLTGTHGTPGPAPAQPLTLPPGMPTASTPRYESETVKQAGYNVASENIWGAGPLINGKVPETTTPLPRPLPVPPPPVKPAAAETKPAAAETKPAAASTDKPGVPLMRLINTRRIELKFEVNDVGPSGLSLVELWWTQLGHEWKKHNAPAQASAYVVEVDEEGMYGFTLLARSGTGRAKQPPQAGDQPQVWVIVDLSKPEVRLSDVTPGLKGGKQQVAVKWSASDRNLGRNPITLAYAEKEEGPWKVVASGLENTGVYNWEVPKGTPARVLFRVEACDLAGNVGSAQSSRAVLMDNSLPSVSIVNVQAQ